MEQEDIIKAVNTITKTNIKEITRKREFVEARALYYKIAKELTPNVTLSKLGEYSNRNHATVIHSLKNYNTFEKFNPTLKKYKERVFNILKQEYKPITHYNYKETVAEYKIMISFLKEENNILKEKIAELELKRKFKILAALEELLLNSPEEQQEAITDKLKAFYNINSKLKY